MVPELRKHTQIPVTQAQQGVLGTDSLWVLSLSRTLYRYGTAVRIHTTGTSCVLQLSAKVYFLVKMQTVKLDGADSASVTRGS